MALVNTRGRSSGYRLSVSGDWRTNGLRHGGLADPDSAALGPIGLPSATQDYFFTVTGAAVTLGGLTRGATYEIGLFASRANAQERITQLTVAGATTEQGTLQSSGSALGGDGANRTSVLVVPAVQPDADGRLHLAVEKAAGAYGYVNALRVRELPAGTYAAAQAINVGGAVDITGNGARADARAQVRPADARYREVAWEIADVTLAHVLPDGTVLPKRNGSSELTARNLDPGAPVSARSPLSISGQRATAYLLDFGADDGADGTATASPDAAGTHWNNIVEPDRGAPVALVSTDGDTAAITVEAVGFAAGGLRDGGLATPDPALLGDLGVATATQDYFATSGPGIVLVNGLDPAAGYRLFALASHDDAAREVTQFRVAGSDQQMGLVQSSGAGAGGGGAQGNDRAVYASQLFRSSPTGGVSLLIDPAEGEFGYLNALQLVAFDSVGACPNREPRKIVYMGSSVARGQGAPGDQGYAFQVARLLGERAASGAGGDFGYANVSVGGNRTTDVLARYDRDLVPQCGGYVVFGLSLANEGIRGGGQAVYEQFRDNLRLLVDKARGDGYQPVVVSNYARGDYDAGDYEFIKRINIEIAQWDVPSVNVLGALDDGNGRWPAGYAADNGHPNLAGHEEFAKSFVPSLFDALEAGKPAPQRMPSAGITPDGICIVIEGAGNRRVESFTQAFEYKSEVPGPIATAISVASAEPTEIAELEIDSSGQLIYQHDDGQTLRSTSVINDGAWHDIALTYYHASERTALYLDGQQVGELDASWQYNPGFLLGIVGDASTRIRQLYSYRAGMNADEIALVAADSMLTSSLEIYAPLDSSSIDPYANFAQSLSTLGGGCAFVPTRSPRSGQNLKFDVFPNPTDGSLNVRLAESFSISDLRLFDAAGRVILSQRLAAPTAAHTLDLAPLPAGTYTLAVRTQTGQDGYRTIVVE